MAPGAPENPNTEPSTDTNKIKSIPYHGNQTPTPEIYVPLYTPMHTACLMYQCNKTLIDKISSMFDTMH